MSGRARGWIAAVLLVLGCEDPLPEELDPAASPSVRLLNVELSLAAMETAVEVSGVRGTEDRLEAIRFLRKHVVRAVEEVQDPERFAAAMADLQVLEVGQELERIDMEGTLAHISTAGRHACNQGLARVFQALRLTEGNPSAATSQEVRQLLREAREERQEALNLVRGVLVLRAGMEAASIVSGAYSLAKLKVSGVPQRIADFLKPGEAAVLSAAGAGGAVSVRVLSSSGALVLTEAEVMALAQAGVLSAAAVHLLMMNKAVGYDRGAFEKWIAQAKTGPPRGGNSGATEYQVRHCGPHEYYLPPGAGKGGIWADGVRVSDGTIIETKFVHQPGTSPYVPGSKCPGAVCEDVLRQTLDELRRYAQVLRTPGVPARSLEIVTNHPEAAKFFSDLLRKLGIPGRVVVRP